MSAHKTGGTAARKRVKDSAMAARMKAEHVERSTMRHPITGKMVAIASFNRQPLK